MFSAPCPPDTAGSDLLHRLAPFRATHPARVDAPVASLSLFGLDEREQLLCLDAIDLCCADRGVQLIEIYLHDFKAFTQASSTIPDGLALVKLPRSLNTGELTSLSLRLACASEQLHLTIVPVQPALRLRPSTEAMLECLSPYCQVLLHEDSDAVDYAHVLSAFLHLPKLPSSKHINCQGCEHYNVRNTALNRPAALTQSWSRLRSCD